MIPNERSRTETKTEVCAYLQNLKYALQNGARIMFQATRSVDKGRGPRYTNKFTVADLFPDEDPVVAVRSALQELSAENYMRTAKDLCFPTKSEMREFGKVYKEKGEVYIKIRVELLCERGMHSTFVMSFHYAETPFADEMFPYKDRGSRNVY